MIKQGERFIERMEASTLPRCDEAGSVAASSRIAALAKRIIFSLYLYSGYVQARDLILSMLGRSRAVVLYYHRIGSRDVLTRPADEFRRDLDYFKRHYDCISFSELCSRLRANLPLRRRAIVITFDDGYRDNFTEAMPALKAAGMTATFFVATGYIGTSREFPHDTRSRTEISIDAAGDDVRERVFHPKLTWDDLRAMEARGFEIGSHTVNHANLGRANDLMIEEEVNDSLAALNRELGARPRAFSFPWGKPADISKRAIEAVERAGYYAAASAYGGANSRGANLFNIRRLDVGNGHLERLALRARVAGFDIDYFRLKLKNWNV